MRKEQYPLETARAVRESELEACQKALGEHTRALENAVAETTVRERSLSRHRDETNKARERERRAGPRTVAESLRSAAYFERRAAEERRLNEVTAAARSAEKAARERHETARNELAAAHAALEAIEQHKEHWEAAGRKAAADRAEIEAEDRIFAERARDKPRR